MIVYTAARYSRKNELRSLVTVFNEHNITVRARWLDETHAPETTLHDVSPAFCRETATIDMEDIDACDTFVFFSEDPTIGIPRGGRHVEFGYALARGKRLVVIGGPENIFHFLSQVVHYPNLQYFLEAEGISNELVAD